MIKILLDSVGVNIVSENFDFFQEKKDKCEFYISPTVLEEFTNMNSIDYDKLKEKTIEEQNDYILKRIKKHEKFIVLLIQLSKLTPKFLLDSVLIANHSRVGCACLGDGIVYKTILKETKGNVNDAIIADTAVNNDCYLLTGDDTLYKKMTANNYKVLNIEDCKKLLA
ncbi:MAG: hypothetical protein J6A63_08330 [Clostridia bacterium]|nr:hypothetical protein [Clostridia bacterium]